MSSGSDARIRARLQRLGVEHNDDQRRLLATYYDLLYRWNARINLTSLTDGDAAIDRLIVEPVMAASSMPVQAVHLDVGSGGGSPALPVLVMRPAFRSVLVESRSRKVAFLREAIRAMGLRDAVVSNSRLEGLQVQETPFSLVTIRAVRIDNELKTGIERVVSPGATAWCFTTSAEAAAFGEGWSLGIQRDLVPEQLSIVRCFTWNNDEKLHVERSRT